MASYTFKQRTSPTYPGQLNNLGGLVTDGNHVGMTGYTGAGIQTVDISGTPVVSPATVSNSAVTTLTIPYNAVAVNFIATTNTVNISEADPSVATKYFTIPIGAIVSMDIARMSVLYLEANTGSATLSFYFTVI